MTVRPGRDGDILGDVGRILGRSYDLPDSGGTGRVGRALESLLRIEENNQDLPDAGRFEVKFTSRTSYVTLLHKDPGPAGMMRDFVSAYGYWDRAGRRAMRLPIPGNSNGMGFVFTVDDDCLRMAKEENAEFCLTWSRNDLTNAAASKLRNLILVTGSKGGGWIRFDSARVFRRFRISDLYEFIVGGMIITDIDARFTAPNTVRGGLRNHGTKFRVRPRDVGRLYEEAGDIQPG